MRFEHQVEQAAHAAAARLLTHTWTRVRGAGDEADALSFTDDLKALAAIIDPVIQATGEYIADNFGVRVDTDLFRGRVLDALGEPICAVEKLADQLADDELEMRADPIGWARAAEFGVD